jgi:hypothetical protein
MDGRDALRPVWAWQCGRTKNFTKLYTVAMRGIQSDPQKLNDFLNVTMTPK